MRYRRNLLFVLIAAVGFAACGGHSQVPPQTVPPTAFLQAIDPTQDPAVVAAQTQAMSSAKRRLQAAQSLAVPAIPTPGCDTEFGVANCNVYVGTHFDWHQTINNTDGGASPPSLCKNIVFDPMPGDANAGVQAVPQPIPASGPCSTVNAPVIWRITGKKPYWLDLTAGVTYYTIGVDSGSGRWHWNYGFIVSVWTGEQSAIAAQALKWMGQNDSGFGAPCDNACVVTVNNIVHMATGKWLGGDSGINNVDPLRKNGDVTAISQSDAVPGDFLIVDSADGINGHIGICLNLGCTNVISNSSTHCTFTFESDNDARFSYTGSPYNGGTSSYWRAVLK